MNNIIQIWNTRTKREKNLVLLILILLTFFIISNGFLTMLSSSKTAKRQYLSAKIDYEYVEASAKELMFKSKAENIRNDRTLLRKALIELAQTNNINLGEINFQDLLLTASFDSVDISQTVKFIESVSLNFGLSLKSIVIEASDEEKLTTVEFKF